LVLAGVSEIARGFMTLDLDVILAAHGAGDDSAANESVRALARELERRVVGGRVSAAFHKGEPSYASGVRGATRANRIVVPLLTSDGFHYARLECAVVAADPTGLTQVLRPLGANESFVHAFVERVTEQVDLLGFDRDVTHIIVVGHGTDRHPTSGLATSNAAAALQQSGFDCVRAAFLDEDPTIEAVASTILPHEYLVVVPFLLGLGAHAIRDLPARIVAATSKGPPAHHVAFVDPISALPELAELIERVIRNARPDRLAIRAGARGSQLSRRQVGIFAAEIAPLGVDVSFVEIETRGDRDRSTPISEFEGGDPFSREITDALMEGRIDVAVHSLKDLPLENHPLIRNVAILRRGSVHEVLIARDGLGLHDLPTGARIGTSCSRRASQLLRVRPDLVPVPIRGDVPTRVEAVARGEFDAVILAAAGIERLGLETKVTEHLDVAEFVPAPGQGAVVVQSRVDWPNAELIARVDHAPTRHAVEAELAAATVS
jgi:hydroxymethylbilane synthase